ncbi:hypothetical protein [Pseudaquabacterium pictum]|uniref:Uncharacterized protein n=1 Tax=Pseudaquabacterium pictum TaxID=2315236 RepID=A0A480AY55_9BURK|nr:hypothetical protein [Rubrivivax pictus]GCL66374.1 hypothetical protein AQPW35_54550 [Rubrivivax pictus]
MAYRLWLPHCGTYVRATRQNNRQIIGTANPADALRLPELQAIHQARALIRRAGQVVELRPAEPTDTDHNGVQL